MKPACKSVIAYALGSYNAQPSGSQLPCKDSSYPEIHKALKKRREKKKKREERKGETWTASTILVISV